MTRYPAGFRFAEWRNNGTTHDYGEPCEECELCGMTGLRYHFEIDHHPPPDTERADPSRLLIGSECILRFDIPYFEKGVQITDKAELRRELARRMREMRRETMVKALLAAAAKRNNDALLIKAAAWLDADKALPPVMASTVIWLLHRDKVEHPVSAIRVRLSRNEDIDALRRKVGQTWRLRFLWPALSPAQRKTVQGYGLKPPG